MAGWKETLEKAIQTGKWEDVRKYYEHFYDEQPPQSPTVVINTDSGDMLKKHIEELTFQSIAMSKTIDLLAEYYDIERPSNWTTNDVEQESGQEVNTFNIGEDNQIPEEGTMKFVTGSVPKCETKEYKQKLKEHAKIVSNRGEGRTPYKSNMKKCSKCQIEFDYNKEYPVGKFGDRDNIACYNCKKTKA